MFGFLSISCGKNIERLLCNRSLRPRHLELLEGRNLGKKLMSLKEIAINFDNHNHSLPYCVPHLQ